MILGGPYVSFQYEQILRQFGGIQGLIDFTCLGEAEYSFLKLSRLLLSMPNYKRNFQDSLTQADLLEIKNKVKKIEQNCSSQ
ncbi:MAG: hypothetical protein ACTSUN_03265 [Promethearchaeota archaeon]